MRRFLRNYFASDQRWFFWSVLLLLIFANFYSVKSRVTPEPGVALSIYSSYNAMMRVGGIDTIGFEAAPQYRKYLENEEKQMVVAEETCTKMLKDKNNSCQASNVIPASERLQHWKSYLLPSVLAAAAFDSTSITEIRRFDSTNPNKPAEPTPKLYRNLRENGIIFFAVLLAIKGAVWFVVWFGSRRVVTRFVAGWTFLVTTFWGLVVDFALRRGAGVYALDRLIAGSPRFDPETSLARAVPLAFFDVLKAVIAPSPSTSFFGLTPRSVVIFIAVMMFIAIVFERSWKFLILVPVGLGIHFTTFAILLVLMSPSFLYLLVRQRTSDFRFILNSIALSMPVVWLQLRDSLPGDPEFSFWPVFVLFSLLTIAVPAVAFLKDRPTPSATPCVDSAISSIKQTIGLLGLMFVGLTGYSIWRLGRSYGFSDSAGFWTDGFLREGAGRAAPLIGALVIFLPVALMVESRQRTQASAGGISRGSECAADNLLSTTRIQMIQQLLGVLIMVTLAAYVTRNFFL